MKNKNWLNLVLLIVIGFLVMGSLSDKEILIQPAAQNQIKAIETASIKVDTKPSKKIEVPINKVTIKPYKVETHYPTQDVFDDNICSIDKLHTDYQSSLSEAIKRLEHQYQHHHYQLNEYIELNLYTASMTTYFEKELIERIKALHLKYVKLLGESAERVIKLNLVITSNRSDYEQFFAFYTDNPIESLGVYFGGLNIAYIDYQNSDDKALKTSIHETVHALNAHIIGKTPRMFNEGMAEFFEDMTVKEGNVDIVYYRNQLTKEPYPLMQFFDYQQWSSLDIHHLYYSSWAWIAFMFSDNNRLHSLISFMKKEQVDACSAFSAGETYKIFQEIYSMLEPDFYHWQQNLNSY